MTGDRIALVGPAGTVPAGAGRTEHDLRGHALAPGFIDAHTHDDRIVLDAPDMLPKISQGVTTVVAGNCGISLAPVTFDGLPAGADEPPRRQGGVRVPALRRLRQAGGGGRAGGQCRRAHRPLGAPARDDAGHQGRRDEGSRSTRCSTSSTRRWSRARPGSRPACSTRPTRRPISTRWRRSRRASPEHGGVYATHMRDETDRVLNSIDEALATAGRAKIQLVISHHKCAHPAELGPDEGDAAARSRPPRTSSRWRSTATPISPARPTSAWTSSPPSTGS